MAAPVSGSVVGPGGNAVGVAESTTGAVGPAGTGLHGGAARQAAYRYVPNAITVGRLFLAGLFFVLLNIHVGPHYFAAEMWVSFTVWLVAVFSDAVDGYLARAWHVESSFGRVVDPFVDKIMVAGAFVFFCSPAFLSAAVYGRFHAADIQQVTGVAPWMAVVIIAREFLVTGIRGLAESRGIDFRAAWSGKIKMIVQSTTVAIITGELALQAQHGFTRWLFLLTPLREFAIYLTVIITIFSALGYVMKAWRTIDA